MKEPNIPDPPRGGVYGDVQVIKAYRELYRVVHEWMDDQTSDAGNLSTGAGLTVEARARAVARIAQNFADMVKARCKR